MRSISEVEKDMKELYPQKEIAKVDYKENLGDTSGLREQLFREYKKLADEWNTLVDERNAILNQ